MNVTHEKGPNTTDTWLTPPNIIKSLGEFDLDPCSPLGRPWDTAKHHYTILDNGLIKDWFGRVWCNPPYSDIESWLKKCSEYCNVIALVFARTETKAFHNWVWNKADSVFFFEKRLRFYTIDGIQGGSAGAPSILISYNEANSQSISDSGLLGKHLPVNYTPMIIVGVSPTWMSIVSMAIRQVGDDELKPLYDMVERLAPDKTSNNQHWKAKIRQTVYALRKKSGDQHSYVLN